MSIIFFVWIIPVVEAKAYCSGAPKRGHTGLGHASSDRVSRSAQPSFQFLIFLSKKIFQNSIFRNCFDFRWPDYVIDPVRINWRTSNPDCIWLSTVHCVFTMSIGFVPNETTGWIDFVSIAKIKCQNNSKLTTVIHRHKKYDSKSRGNSFLPCGKYRTYE